MVPAEAIVLAGGLGTRLRSVVADVPKPLAPVAGRPFLDRILLRLRDAGVRRVVLSIGHLGHLIEARYGAAWEGLAIAYAREETPLGTGGGLRRALAALEGTGALALNGDTWFDLDLGAFAAACGGGFGLALRRLDEAGRYGTVRVEGGRVMGFLAAGQPGPGLINGGVYHLPRGLFAGFDLQNAFSFERDFLARHVAALRPAAYESDADFIDIGVPDDYARAAGLFV